MAAIRIQPFSGIVPKLSANLLSNGQAQTAINAKLFSGEIRPWRQSTAISTTLCTSAITVYRLRNASSEKWLSWAYDVDVIPSQVADTTDYRIYYTINGVGPRKTNWALASTGPGPWPAADRELGVVAPVAAPVLTKVDGTGTSESRSYIYTNISTFGSVLEESAPSSATIISVLPTGGSVTLAGFDKAPLLSTITPGSGYTNGTYAGVTMTLNGGTAPTTYPLATIAVSGGVVTSVSIDSPGSGYGATTSLTAPAASIGGTGSGFSVMVGYNITSRRIYRSLTDSYLLVKDLPVTESAVTISNASPGVVTWTAHGRSAGDTVFFRTTGALPTGLSTNTAYYVIAAGLTANTFEVSATVGGAAINTSSAGSGVHTGCVGFIDNLTATTIPGDNLPSLNWTTPDPALRGLVSMPNGILAGFVGNTVYFSEPYYPHAWPFSYAMTVNYQIVGLGVYGSSLVVITEGYPTVITGTHPSSMTQEQLSVLEPGMAKLSIAQDKYGVMYASPNGLVAVGPGTLDVISQDLYSRDDWQAITPSSLVATIYNGRYIAAYGSEGKSIILSREDKPPLAEVRWQVNKFYVDRQTAKMYGVSSVDNTLYQLDADANNNLTFEWKSQRFVTYKPEAFTCFQLDADYNSVADTNALIAANAANASTNSGLISSGLTNGYVNGATLNTYAINGSALLAIVPVASRSVSVSFYNDGTQVYSTNVASIEPLRLPPYRSYVWEIVISGTVGVRSFAMASSIQELKTV